YSRSARSRRPSCHAWRASAAIRCGFLRTASSQPSRPLYLRDPNVRPARFGQRRVRADFGGVDAPQRGEVLALEPRPCPVFFWHGSAKSGRRKEIEQDGSLDLRIEQNRFVSDLGKGVVAQAVGVVRKR